MLMNFRDKKVGDIDIAHEGDIISMEVDLTSEDKEKRTLKYFVNGKLQKYYFINVPLRVNFAVNLSGKDNSIEFLFLNQSEKSEGDTESDSVGKDWGKENENGEEEYKPLKGDILKKLTPLPQTSFFFSDSERMTLVDNRILHLSYTAFDTCLIGNEIKQGVHRITFEVDRFPNNVRFGVMNASFSIPPVGETISSSKQGVEFSQLGVGRAKSEITDAQSNLIGWGNVIKPFSTVSLELDLRSEEKEKRTLHFIVDGYQQECYFYNVPESVKVGLCIKGKDPKVELKSWEEFSKPTTIPLKWEQGYNWNGE